MSDSPATGHPPGAPSIKVEPDDVPTRFLAMLGLAVTVVVTLMVVGAYYGFHSAVDAEMQRKGYTASQLNQEGGIRR